MPRIIVSGTRLPRKFSEDAVWAVLDAIAKLEKWKIGETTIIEGGARGVDTFAKRWAESRKLGVDHTPIDKEQDGVTENAPKFRNYRMLYKEPDKLIAFPGGPGTNHMIEITGELEIPVYDVEFDGPEFRVWHLPLRRGDKAKLLLKGMIPK